VQSTIGHLEGIQQPLVDQKAQLNDILVRLPTAFKIIGRAGGIYGTLNLPRHVRQHLSQREMYGFAPFHQRSLRHPRR